MLPSSLAHVLATGAISVGIDTEQRLDKHQIV